MFPDGPGTLGISESFLAFTCVPTLLGYNFSSCVHGVVHLCKQRQSFISGLSMVT